MNKPQLRDYQIESLKATADAARRGIYRQMIVLPTGGGKTVVMAHIADYHENSYPMLVLAHREELLEQARDKFLWANPDLKVGIEMASSYADLDCDVVFASVATIGRSGSSRIERFSKNHFNTVVCDESHHASASTYQNVFNYFTGSKLRIGFTATPKRADGIRLDNTFDEIVYSRNMLEMINEGYLSRPICYRLNSSVDISEVSVNSGDYAIGELSRTVNVEARHEACVEAFEKVSKELGRQPSTVIFCVDIAHAESLAKHFTNRGYPAKMVSGQSVDREEVIASHKAGEFKILANCQKLIEGYDDPNIEAVIMARPTKSGVFYSQAIGRGARLDGRENKFYVIDIVDATMGKRPISILSLMGLPAEFEADGEDVVETFEAFDRLLSKSPHHALHVKSLKDIDLAWEKIDIFAAPKPNEALLQFSKLLWMEVGETFVINGNKDTQFRIEPNQIGTFDILVNGHKHKTKTTLAAAFAYADKSIRTRFSDEIKLLDATAQWRLDPPTEKQIKILKKYHVPYDDITKGQASQIIDKIFAENPKPKRTPAQEWAIKKAQQKKAFKF